MPTYVPKPPNTGSYSRGTRWTIWAATMFVIALFLFGTGILQFDRFVQVFQTETRDQAFKSSTQHIVGTVKQLQQVQIDLAGDISDNQRSALTNYALQLGAEIDMEDERVPDALRIWYNSLSVK